MPGSRFEEGGERAHLQSRGRSALPPSSIPMPFLLFMVKKNLV